MTTPLLRRPTFWIAFAAVGLAGAVLAVRLFTVALPVVSLEIEMDRQSAMTEAGVLAERYGWGPDDARAAASFGQVDPEVQTYVELEGGGRGAFQELMDAGIYHPYQWRVRRFAEGEVEEVQVRFTPAGDAYGFRRRLREDDPGGGNLDEQAARALAEREAALWAIDIADYELIEASDEAQPGGRVDHTFVYQRTDVSVGQARFRLRLVIAGNGPAAVEHFVFVPQAFSRRYADMRSTNDGIALAAQAFMILVYVLLGAGVGTALLLRRRWIEWRTALAWGALTAFLLGLNTVNGLPLAWMGYDTAMSAGWFVLQNVAAAGAALVFGTPLLAFVFLAGESLGRRAFPAHLQQWRFWSPEVAASKTALGLTVAAYLLVGIQVGYVVLFYLGTSRLEGWWSPADALVQPDLLATYQPWLQAVSLSLFASLWEESVFRAVPIACAALIGARYGGRNAWVWGAVVVQAIVFAAGHANYPQQPAYARLVELTPPALAWGAIYVSFGLVPTILAHFLYDLTLISSVLFSSDAVFDQAVTVGVGAVPLAVVLWARRRGRAADRPPAWAYNGAWSPPAEDAGAAAAEAPPGATGVGAPGGPGGEPAAAAGGLAGVAGGEGSPAAQAGAPPPAGPVRISRGIAAGAALLGIGLWIASLVVADPPPRFEVSRSQAIERARAELERRGFDMEGWTGTAVPSDGRSPAHRYVVEEAGVGAYERLLGGFLPPPQWIVRFVDWDAEPAERVEELLVNVETDGTIRRVAHALPEARPGADLEEDSALALARAALPPGDWSATGAEESTHEARTDWTFTFLDTTASSDLGAEARASVTVLGNEVTGVRRYVQVPEAWERSQREAASRRDTLTLGLMLTLGLLFATAAVVAIVAWARHSLEIGPLWKVGAATLAVTALASANGWPAATALLSTAQPFELQAGGAAFGLVLVALVAGSSVGLVAALGHTWRERTHTPLREAIVLGGAAGLLLGGVASLASALASDLPPLPDYSGAGAFAPALAPPLDGLVVFLLGTTGASVLASAHRRFAGRAGLRGVTMFAILALGVVAVPDPLRASIAAWVAGAVIAAAVVGSVVRLLGAVPAAAPPLVAVGVVLGVVPNVLHRPYPGAAVGGLLALVVLCVAARVWAAALTGRR